MDKADKAQKVVEFLKGSGDLSKHQPAKDKKQGGPEPKLPRF